MANNIQVSLLNTRTGKQYSMILDRDIDIQKLDLLRGCIGEVLGKFLVTSVTQTEFEPDYSDLNRDRDVEWL